MQRLSFVFINSRHLVLQISPLSCSPEIPNVRTSRPQTKEAAIRSFSRIKSHPPLSRIKRQGEGGRRRSRRWLFVTALPSYFVFRESCGSPSLCRNNVSRRRASSSLSLSLSPAVFLATHEKHDRRLRKPENSFSPSAISGTRQSCFIARRLPPPSPVPSLSRARVQIEHEQMARCSSQVARCGTASRRNLVVTSARGDVPLSREVSGTRLPVGNRHTRRIFRVSVAVIAVDT